MGWPGMGAFTKRYGIYMSVRSFSPDTLQGIAELAGLPLDEVHKIAYLPHDKMPSAILIQGRAIDSRFIEHFPRYTCPLCIAEEPFHRAKWDLIIYDACAKHGCRLHRRCPNCRRDLGYRPDLAKCKCGCDLRSVLIEADPSDIADAVAIEAALKETAPGSMEFGRTLCDLLQARLHAGKGFRGSKGIELRCRDKWGR